MNTIKIVINIVNCMAMVDNVTDNLKRFTESRRAPENAPLCYAPSLSLNFEQSGNVTACCFNRQFVLGKYPQDSIREIWSGKQVKKLRKAMTKNDFSLGCQQCEKMINEGNFESVLIKHFDDFSHLDESKKSRLLDALPFFNSKTSNKEVLKPKILEFELSNTCNLECIMCGGNWSSSIRKNREGLPELHSPYDDEFVKQLVPYLVDVERINFLGGEPFLIKVYLKIWEKIIKHKPSITIAITSNGTVLNSRIKRIIDELPNCKITLSIDSLVKETWESIRLGGSFSTLKKNMEWLKSSGKLVSFSVCPIIQNWREIPELVAYCQQENLDIYFNVVYGPLGGKIEGIHEGSQSKVANSSLLDLSKSELQGVLEYYNKFSFDGRQGLQFKTLVKQIEYWFKQKES